MPYNGTGTFTPVYSWQTDAANGILVRADRMDTETLDIASGLSNCMTRDGQSSATASQNMGGQKIINMANGAATTDAVAYGQVFTGATFNNATLAGTTAAPTQTAGDSSTSIATTAFVSAAAFSAALPAQLGNSGKVVTTNGTVASWTSTLASFTLTNPTITDLLETAYAPAAGSAFTVNWTNGTIQRFTTNANCTITLPSAAAGKGGLICIVYGGAHTLTFAGGTLIKYNAGAAPTPTSVNGKKDYYAIVCDDATATSIQDGGRNF